MDAQTVETAVESLGFTEYQAAVYTALCQLGSASAVQIANKSDIPQSRVYDVLRDLESNGYVETYEQDSLSARVINTDDIKEQLQEHSTLLADAADDIDEMLSQPYFDENEVTLLKREQSVVGETKRAIKDADTKVQLAVSLSQLDKLRESLITAREAGVFVRLTLFPLTLGDTVDIHNESINEIATEVKKQTLPGQFLCIVDQSYVSFVTNHSVAASKFGITANSPSLAYVFNWYFNYGMWSGWELVHSGRDNRPPIQYIDIERCVYDIYPLIEEDSTVNITVEGKKTNTNESITVSGIVDELRYGGDLDEQNQDAYPADFSNETSIVMSTENKEWTIGGWIPSVEDVEMHRITVNSVS